MSTITPTQTSFFLDHSHHSASDTQASSVTQSSPTSSTSDNAVNTLTRENFRIKDKNNDGKIDISYKFFNSNDSDTTWLKSSGAREFSEARKKAFKSSMQAWEDVAKIKFTENAKNADASFVLHASKGVGGLRGLSNGWNSDPRHRHRR